MSEEWLFTVYYYQTAIQIEEGVHLEELYLIRTV